MLRTIMIGNAIFVQGVYVKTLSDGRMSVKVDDTIYSGMPVKAAA
ncbi:MAG: hypothetical protein AAF218_01770 [Pseudomonadota bacterium]